MTAINAMVSNVKISVSTRRPANPARHPYTTIDAGPQQALPLPAAQAGSRAERRIDVTAATAIRHAAVPIRNGAPGK